MGAKPKLELDIDKITSGLSIEKTMKKIEIPEDSSNSASSADIREFKRIFYKKLKSSPLNDYPIENIEEMEKLLLSYGLLEPFSVSYVEDEDVYEIESGDRRYHSLLNLFQRYEKEDINSEDPFYILYMKNVHTLYLNGIYCMVENGPKDDDSKRSRIIIHNETNRPFDPIRTSSKLAELSEIYSRQNKALPFSERVNVNEKICQNLNGRYGVRQIIRYKNFDSLIDELKNVVVKYNMNISEISKYHNLTSEEQEVLAQYIEECYSAGRPVELPTMETIKDIVAATHNEIQDKFSATDNDKDEIPSEVDEVLFEEVNQDSVSDDMASIQDLRSQAAKKIMEGKSKKEIKIKEAVNTLQKKSQNLEKVIISYIEESDEPQINVADVVSCIDEIVEKLNSIKSTLNK